MTQTKGGVITKGLNKEQVNEINQTMSSHDNKWQNSTNHGNQKETQENYKLKVAESEINPYNLK